MNNKNTIKLSVIKLINIVFIHIDIIEIGENVCLNFFLNIKLLYSSSYMQIDGIVCISKVYKY